MELLIEIGTEEIPASYLEPGALGISRTFRELCAKQRLSLFEPRVLWTPRRMTFHFAEVAEAGESVEELRRGPPVSAAYDGEGEPTKAALGFARGQGVEVADLEVVDTKRGKYVGARVMLTGEPTARIVSEALPSALRAAPFPKSMRWSGSDLAFARPIRNLVVLLGSEVVPVEAAGLLAGRTTRGHAFLGGDPFPLETADLGAYLGSLRERRVLADPDERRAAIVEGLSRHLDPDQVAAVHARLLAEVTNLAEWPVVLEGRIDPEYLELPREVLEVAMRVHLRFFPVLDASGRAEPRFLAAMDRPVSSAAVVRSGNERVLRSRLADARFFLQEDRKRRLSEFVPELSDKALHAELGSYGDKAVRLAELADFFAGGGKASALARRAAHLAKADLVTEMVGEFPELQGTVGRVYALLDGEDARVAEAIEDHHRPRGPRDELPRGTVALALSVAEKIDDLTGFVRVAGLPSGSSDPLGLRRQALGLIRIAREKRYRFPLAEGLGRAAELYGAGEEDLVASVLAFVRERLYRFCVDEGHRYDLVRACLATGFDDLVELFDRLEAVGRMAGETWWGALVEVVERTANILGEAVVPESVEEERLREPEEKGLAAALTEGEAAVSALLDRGEYAEAGREMAERFARPVHEFFDKVYVNVEDEALKANRMALLGRVNRLFTARVADLSRVEQST